ncbi:MAG: hypothetical protein Q9191_000387 [Dirinaria sp. TL-2023a]
MHTQSIISLASLLATVSASPYRPVIGNPGKFPTGARSAPTGTAAAAMSTGTGTSSDGNATSVHVREKLTGPLAVTKLNDHDGSGAGKDVYKMYTGDGSESAGWPSLKDWVSYGDMWKASSEYMKTSCSQFNVPNDSEEEISHIKSAIAAVARASKVDHRFILAIIMQESKGCVRVHTTRYSHANPGLMQSHEGEGTCNDDKTKKVSNPCPQKTIEKMVSEGTAGTASGSGLAKLLNKAGGHNAQTYYRAARLYNSGDDALQQSGSKDLEKGIATHCYASDVANRLTGWVKAETKCNLQVSKESLRSLSLA